MALFIGILGKFFAHGDDGELPRPRRHCRALLGYVAAHADETLPRDRLAALLWPQNGSPRHRLRQSIMEIRQTLGPAAIAHIISGWTNFGLSGVSTDIAAFERLSRSSDRLDLQKAAALYRGEFLSDASVSSEPFLTWLSSQRGQTLNIMTSVLSRLATAELAAGDRKAAIRAVRRLLALDPLSDAGMRTALDVLAQCGERPIGLRLYREFRDRLRRELDEEPEPETDALAQRINRAGHRQGATPRRDKNIIWPFLPPPLAVAVQPIRNLTGTAKVSRLGDGLTDDIISDLVQCGRRLGLGQILDGRRHYARMPGPADADYVVTGSAQPGTDGRLRINLQIIDAVTSEYCWSHRYESTVAQLPAAQLDITRDLSRQLHFLLIGAAGRRVLPELDDTVSPGDYVARGLATISGPDSAQTTADAQRSFLRALALDPRHVGALTGFALTCQHIVGQPWWADPDARLKATTLGLETAATALSLNPDHAFAHLVQGMLYSAEGKLDDARSALDRGMAADPYLGVLHAYAAYHDVFCGMAHKALPTLKKTQRLEHLDRRRGFASFYAGFSSVLLGNTEEAEAYLEKSLQRNPAHGGAQLFLAVAQARGGKRAVAAQTAAKFRAQYPAYHRDTFVDQWLSRSPNPIYRSQIGPLFDDIQRLCLTG